MSASGRGTGDGRGVAQRDLGRVRLDVHRHVEEDGTGTAGAHRVPGALEDEGQLVDA